MTKSNSKILVPRSKWHVFLAICAFTVACNSTLFTSCVYLPVGTVCGIGLSTATSIIAMAFITICIDRKFQAKMYIGATVSFLGIIFLIQSKFLMFPVVAVRNTSWESPCLSFENATNMHQNQTEGTVMAVRLYVRLHPCCSLWSNHGNVFQASEVLCNRC